MNDSEYNELRAASWRRKLTSAEDERAQAYWATHPEAQADWEEDLALTRQLRELPDAPLPSNFTSLVLQAADAEAEAASVPASLASKWSAWVRRNVPRMALAGLAVILGIGAFFQHQKRENQTRRHLAGDVREFVYVTTLPGPEVFEDFDAIQQLKPIALSSALTPSTDDDLLAALQ